MWADFGLPFNHLKADLRGLTCKVPCHEVQRVSHQQQTAGGFHQDSAQQEAG